MKFLNKGGDSNSIESTLCQTCSKCSDRVENQQQGWQKVEYSYLMMIIAGMAVVTVMCLVSP